MGRSSTERPWSAPRAALFRPDHRRKERREACGDGESVPRGCGLRPEGGPVRSGEPEGTALLGARFLLFRPPRRREGSRIAGNRARVELPRPPFSRWREQRPMGRRPEACRTGAAMRMPKASAVPVGAGRSDRRGAVPERGIQRKARGAYLARFDVLLPKQARWARAGSGCRVPRGAALQSAGADCGAAGLLPGRLRPSSSE